MRVSKFGRMAFFAIAALGAFSAVSAQTPRSTPKPLATPPRTLTAAEIISRADELFDAPISRQAENQELKDAAESAEIRELKERINRLESTRGTQSTRAKKPDPEEVQKRMLMNLDILTRAEQRSETLRKQLFELIEKENTVRSRLEQIQFDMRPEMIERTLQLAGSMKPEEIRENRRKSLAAEQSNLQALLTQITTTRASVDASLQRSEILVEKLRTKLEKEIDDALIEAPVTDTPAKDPTDPEEDL